MHRLCVRRFLNWMDLWSMAVEFVRGTVDGEIWRNRTKDFLHVYNHIEDYTDRRRALHASLLSLDVQSIP